MTKSELIAVVAKATGLSERKCTAVINMTIRMLLAVTDRGEEVVIPGFGVFRRKIRQPKRVFRMDTREMTVVPQRSKFTFHASNSLVRRVEDDSEKTA